MEGTDYFCHRTFNIDAANTWEYKSFTYPPNTLSGISANGTGTGFRIVCWLAAGSAFYSSGTEGQWSASSNRYASNQNVNWMDSTSNDFYITGVQLEVGKVATPFEHRSYGEELALCQRYYYQVGKESGSYMSNVGFARGGYLNLVYATVGFPTEMRTTPTLGYGGTFEGVTYSGGYSAVTTTGPVVGDGRGKKVGGLRVEFPSNWTAGDEVLIKDSDGTGFISYDAEL